MHMVVPCIHARDSAAGAWREGECCTLLCFGVYFVLLSLYGLFQVMCSNRTWSVVFFIFFHFFLQPVFVSCVRWRRCICRERNELVGIRIRIGCVRLLLSSPCSPASATLCRMVSPTLD